jgi:hypothetical protein
MLSSRVYSVFKDVISKLRIEVTDANFAQELYDIAHPYVICIHRPTSRAFILNRRYLHITDVSQCGPPEEWVERSLNHLCASSEVPEWAYEEVHSEFDSYWLY